MNTEDSIKDMCRTCMKLFSKTKKKIDKKQSISEVPTGYETSASIMELLQVVQPQIEINIKDSLPTQMCSDCIQKLVESHEFIQMYKKVDKQFRKMLEEVDTANCNYNFNELDETIEFLKEDEHVVETKYEFEIEQINIASTEKEEEDDSDWAEFKDEILHELSEETESKEPCFLNPYSDGSDYEWAPDQTWQKISPKKQNAEHEINDNTADSTSAELPRKRVYKKRKYNKDVFPLPVKNHDDSIPCQECESVFDNVELWQDHMQQHQLEKMPKRKYTKKSNSARENKSNQKLECQHCGKGFSTLSLYKNHMRLHTRKMRTKQQSYLCIECGKSFTNVSGLNTHMLRHRGEKTFQCAHCPKKFVCSSGLYGHMMVHTKEKPFVCDICGSAFHMAYQLRKHNLYHNGVKNYQCEYCDMRFVTREKQRRHMRTHTGEKPYRCKYCERAFAQSNDCVKHLRQHLGDNVYQCDLCPLRFPLARDLRVHFATHKDDDEETRVRNLEARRESERNLQIKLGCKEPE